MIAQKKVSEALSKAKASDLAEWWEMSLTQVNRVLEDENNIAFSRFCKAIDKIGMKLVAPDEIVISKVEYAFLRQLAAKEFEDDR